MLEAASIVVETEESIYIYLFFLRFIISILNDSTVAIESVSYYFWHLVKNCIYFLCSLHDEIHKTKIKKLNVNTKCIIKYYTK